jgi:hypothetical protein
MTGPTPPRRYLDIPEQSAYESGFWQMWKHDSFQLLDRFSDLDGERLAAVLFGAADALIELAERQLDDARFAVELDGDDAA